jgi:hypothetical protein
VHAIIPAYSQNTNWLNYEIFQSSAYFNFLNGSGEFAVVSDFSFIPRSLTLLLKGTAK